MNLMKDQVIDQDALMTYLFILKSVSFFIIILYFLNRDTNEFIIFHIFDLF